MSLEKQTMHWLNTSVRLLAAGALLGSTLAAAPAARPAAHPAAKAVPAPHAVTHHAVVNTHLHLKPTAPKAAKTDARHEHGQQTKTTTTTTVTHHWGHRWHYAQWASLHRATGTIVGRVVNKSGQVVHGASLVLRKANGKSFKRASAKHIVSTGADGRFVMRNVRLGSYRVRAHQGKPNGHVNVKVHGGQTSAVQVQI